MSISESKTIQEMKKAGGIKLLLFLLFLSECWLMAYLFFRLRYEATLTEVSRDWPLPFFDVGDRWMDFLNPIIYAQDLEPYTQRWGNSPPLLMVSAYILSRFIKAGISKYTLYLGTYMVGTLIGVIAVYKMAVHHGLECMESLMLALIAFASFPFLYCFDRGNFVFWAAILILLFICAYEREHDYLAAVLLGLAAALKLYPALLGTLFLADKKYKQAVVCAFTGIVTSVGSLLCFHGGFVWNLKTFLEKSGSYSTVGNEVLSRLMDDKNSFYQLILIPKMMSNNPLTDVWQVPEYVAAFKTFLTLFLVFTILVCLCLKRNHDRVLILTMMMLGYPIESAAYNLVLAVFPLVYWCCKEEKNKVIPVLGVALITMKSVFIVYTDFANISLQAMLNPVLEIAIVIYLICLRRAELSEKIKEICCKNKKHEFVEKQE